jgi:hypothetical protein
MMPGEAQSYMGKSTILKGIGRLYGGLWCLFSRGNKERGTGPGNHVIVPMDTQSNCRFPCKML